MKKLVLLEVINFQSSHLMEHCRQLRVPVKLYVCFNEIGYLKCSLTLLCFQLIKKFSMNIEYTIKLLMSNL